MGAHSILSASSAKRWLNCPGSVEACKHIASKQSTYALEGTTAHYAGERILRGSKPSNLLGTVCEETGILIDEEMLSYVKVYTDEVLRVYKEAGPDAELLIEQSFNLDWLKKHTKHDIPYDLFGTADAVVIDPFNAVWVFDLKYGAGLPVSTDSPQFKYYGLGAIGEDNYDLVEYVHMVRVQPRCELAGDPVAEHVMSYDALVEWGKNVLLEGMIKACKADAPLIGGPWCTETFCPAYLSCKVMAEPTKELMTTVSQQDIKPPDLLSGDEIRLILDNASKVKKYLRKVEDYALDQLKAGHLVPGYQLVRGRGQRVWSNPEEVKSKLVAYGEDIYQPKKIKTPHQMEVMLRSHHKGKALKQAKEELAKSIAHVSGVKVGPIGGSRPPILTEDAKTIFNLGD